MMIKSIKSDHLGGLVRGDDPVRPGTTHTYFEALPKTHAVPLPLSRAFPVGRPKSAHATASRRPTGGGGQPLWDRPTSVPRRPNPAGLGDHRWMVWGGEKQNQLSSHTKRRWFGFVVDTRQSSSVRPVRRHAAKAHTTHLTAGMALQRLVVGNQHPFHLSILHDGLH